jgi:hypothetical protein
MRAREACTSAKPRLDNLVLAQRLFGSAASRDVEDRAVEPASAVSGVLR